MKATGSHYDDPRLEQVTTLAAAAGTGADFELPIFTLPNLHALFSAGDKGHARLGKLIVRTINIMSTAVVTGVATNNCTLNIRIWRAGAAFATLGTITFGVGTNLALLTPTQLAVLPDTPLLEGDVVTVQRVSAGTGLATPQLRVQIDWRLPRTQ